MNIRSGSHVRLTDRANRAHSGHGQDRYSLDLKITAKQFEVKKHLSGDSEKVQLPLYQGRNMAGDRDRDYRRDDSHRDRYRSREPPRHSRDDRENERRRPSRSRSRERYPSPHRRAKREDEDSPPRRRDYSPQDRPYPRQRSFSPHSKRAQRNQRESPARRQSSVKRSESPEAWGSHQHDIARDRSNPRSKTPPKPKEKPNYGLSGLLAAATNMKNGTVLKYQEPPEARKTKGWLIYIYKDGKETDVLRLDSQSSFLVGRDEMVADIPVAHTSCSKQHAVIQFRQVSSKNEFGDVSRAIKPYLIDLDATNGTILNGEKIDSRRYVEIRSEDIVKFGESTREYVFIKDPSVP